MPPQQEQLAFSIFHAKAAARVQSAKAKQQKFVYYTTAATAVQLLKNREIWLRSPTCMNDWSEVQHGIRCFEEAWNGQPGEALAMAIQPIFPGALDEIGQRFDQVGRRKLLAQTYIACLSEHDRSSNQDDDHGRLSMWRAYGGNSGVALVLKGDALWGDSDTGLNVYTSPVEYMSDRAFGSEILALATRLLQNREFLQAMGREQTIEWIYTAATLGMLCVKHPAFSEEREWRIFHSTDEMSSELTYDVEAINGVAQQVVKLPLRNRSDGTKTGRDLKDILDYVLIGPTAYPLVTQMSMSRLLDDLGLDGSTKVKMSGVPLRVASVKKPAPSPAEFYTESWCSPHPIEDQLWM